MYRLFLFIFNNVTWLYINIDLSTFFSFLLLPEVQILRLKNSRCHICSHLFFPFTVHYPATCLSSRHDIHFNRLTRRRLFWSPSCIWHWVTEQTILSGGPSVNLHYGFSFRRRKCNRGILSRICSFHRSSRLVYYLRSVRLIFKGNGHNFHSFQLRRRFCSILALRFID